MLRLSLTQKLMAIILVLALVPLTIISALSLSSMDQVRDDIDILYNENTVVLSKIAEAEASLLSADVSFRQYFLEYNTSESSDYRNDMNDYQGEFSQFLSDYRLHYAFDVLPSMSNIILDQDREDLLNQQEDTLDLLQTSWDQYELDTAEAIYWLGHDDPSSAESARRNATTTLHTIMAYTSTLVDTVVEASDLMDVAALQTIRSSAFWIITACASVGIVVALVTIAISAMITNPIIAVSRTAKTIAEGNFTTRLGLTPSNDEVGDLIRSMNSLIDNTSIPLAQLTQSAQAIANGDLSVGVNVHAKGDLAKLVESFQQMHRNLVILTVEIHKTSKTLSEASAVLADTSKHMTDGTQQVSMSMSQTSRGAETQATRVEEMVRMLDEQTKAIYDVVQSAQNAARASEDASDVAQRGSRSVQDSLDRMNALLESVKETSTSMERLSRKSQEISQIVLIITNIAQQTNLLSLNAAIEAARAGEHGRGFAVVADEVRKLAEGSRKAAGQIEQLLQSVESDISETSQKMGQTSNDVILSATAVSDSLKSLEDIAATVEETAAMVQEISASTEEQKALTESLAKSLDEVATIANETSASAEEVSASSEELASGMEELAASALELAHLANKLDALTAKWDFAPTPDDHEKHDPENEDEE
ncbi:MAG TPA: methyl-accepting chemotaxis protein [Thermoplasmata archaeon]|nr:methyl-accepting chemotaxis protein [Thermoplasmata archaeon]